MRNRVEFLAVIAVRGLVRLLPRRASLGLGSALGRLFYLLHGRRRELAVDNLKAAFPARSKRECRALIRSTFGHFGRHVIEFLNFDAMSANQMMTLVDVEGEERVEQAMAGGTGVMFYTGHFGYWELQIMVHAFRFAPIVMVARTLDNPLLEWLLERIRTRVGTRVIPRRGAVRGLMRALMSGGSVGMMIDQHIQDRSAVTIEFFNRPPRRPRRSRHWRCGPGRRSSRSSRCRCRVVGIASCTKRLLIPRRQTTRIPSEPTHSDVRTCWRCTSDATPISGCGCTGGGGMTLPGPARGFELRRLPRLLS